MLEPEPEETQIDDCYSIGKFLNDDTTFGNIIFNFASKSPELIKDNESDCLRCSRIITPKFMEKESSLATQHKAIQSIYAHSCSVTVVLQEGSERVSFIGSGIIVLKDETLDYMMAFTSAQLFYPNGMNNPMIKEIFVVLSNGSQFTECVATIVEMGDFQMKRDNSSDWALLKINSGMTKDLIDSLLLIPSPSESRSVINFSETDSFPNIYSTLLVGHFTKSSCFLREFENIYLELIPYGMSLSFGWTTSLTQEDNPVYNCGTSMYCCGAPLFKCRINIEQLGEIVKPNQEPNPESLEQLFSKSFISTRIIGIHSSGSSCGNVACSASYFFNSYFQHVYLPHKRLFSLSDRIFIETELSLI